MRTTINHGGHDLLPLWARGHACTCPDGGGRPHHHVMRSGACDPLGHSHHRCSPVYATSLGKTLICPCICHLGQRIPQPKEVVQEEVQEEVPVQEEVLLGAKAEPRRADRDSPYYAEPCRKCGAPIEKTGKRGRAPVYHDECRPDRAERPIEIND